MEDSGHLPVLAEPVCRLLGPALRELIVDCTVGLGGHAQALLDQAGPDCRLIGIDLDEDNLRQAKLRLARFGSRVRLFVANFSDLDAVLHEAGEEAADALLADLGVCSIHLDRPERGFSFQTDGPLDMRLGGEGPTAADLANRLDQRELADIIWRYGEERYSRRIAGAIVRRRAIQPIARTCELADLIVQAVPPAARRLKIHPATRTFQAFRIAVNDELGNLERLLGQVVSRLRPQGRAAIISFHSLEDRLVKRSFATASQQGAVRILTPKPLGADETEVQRNPRSRSAKLRVIEKIG